MDMEGRLESLSRELRYLRERLRAVERGKGNARDSSESIFNQVDNL